MSIFLTLLLIFLTLPLALPAWALLLLTLAAKPAPGATVLTAAPALQAQAGRVPARPRIAVLVPAHNESHHLLPTLACVRAQLRDGDVLLVVADNCNDDTADLARAAGAQVTERVAPLLRGKGYALAHGVNWLQMAPPDVLMVVDADCLLSAHALDVAAWGAVQHAAPVQLLNLMQAGPGAGLRHRILEFAMLVKNKVRPLGTSRLGGSCHLMGTGMALPWGLVKNAPLSTGHVAEDMKLGVDLALRGHPTRFLPTASVTSRFPESSADARAQKSRWEHGHLATLTEQMPQLLSAAIRERNLALFFLGLDLMIPPLALYVLLLTPASGFMLGLAWVWSPAWAAAVLLWVSMLAFGAAMLLAWHTQARHLLALRELLRTPLYALWKLPIYAAYALNQRSGWTRARRVAEAGSNSL